MGVKGFYDNSFSKATSSPGRYMKGSAPRQDGHVKPSYYTSPAHLLPFSKLPVVVPVLHFCACTHHKASCIYRFETTETKASELLCRYSIVTCSNADAQNVGGEGKIGT